MNGYETFTYLFSYKKNIPEFKEMTAGMVSEAFS